jgi:dihydroorotase
MVLEKGKKTGIHVLSCGNVTKEMKGLELTDMETLAENGAVGFTDDGVPLMDEKIVTEAMKMSAKLDMPISFHEENPQLIAENGINRGKAGEYYGIQGSPREAEISLVERDLKLAAQTGAIVNIQHISAKESVEMVRQAKKSCPNVHAEATPHHFTLNEEAAIKYGTLAKMNPPLREEKDRLEIIRGLADGTIDIIATDHAPHTKEEKEQTITSAPSGIIGLETSLSLGITELVDEGYITLKQLLAAMSTNPASMYHLNAGYIAEGGPADLVLVDTGARVTVGDYVSKASNSPFTGWELNGKVMYTICAGQIVYTERIIGK